MDFIKIALIILVTTFTVSCMPSIDKSIATTVNIGASLLVLWMIIGVISPVIENIKNVFSGYYTGDLSIVFKSLGISLITQFVADIATDNGNKSLANGMILTGKLAIIVLAMPIYIKVLEIMERILK